MFFLPFYRRDSVRIHRSLLAAAAVIFGPGLLLMPASAQQEQEPERNPELRLLQQTSTTETVPVAERTEPQRAPEERLLAQTTPQRPGPGGGAAGGRPLGPGGRPLPGGGGRLGPGSDDSSGRRGPGMGGGPGMGSGPGGGFGGPGVRRPGFGPGASTTSSTASLPPTDDIETLIIEGDQVSLAFPNNPVIDMLNIYERLTDKTLVKDTNIFEGATISLVTPKPVMKDEAVRLIEVALLTNGYAIVDDPGGKSARILPTRGTGVQNLQFSAGVRFYTEAKDLPDGETLVTYFMKLKFLDPTEAQEILANHVGLNVYGRITPVLTPPGLLITESATIVKQLISIHTTIDIGDTGSALITKFIPLTYADAATVAQIVQSTVAAQATERETKGIKTSRGEAQPNATRRDGENRSSDGGSSSSSSRPSEPPRPAQPIFYNGQWVYPPGQNSGAAAPTSQVVADTRLNQILVVATPEDFTYIASLITEFDKPVTVTMPYERSLRYASAVDVLPALVDLLQDTSTGTTQLPGGGTLQAGSQSQSLVSTSRSQLLGGRTTTSTRGGTIASSSTGSGGGGGVAADGTTASATSSTGIGGRTDIIQGPSEDNAPVSVLVNKVRIVADPMANSILVMGRKEDSDKVDSLLDKLDRKPAQVYLATVIGQLTLGEGFEWGIDYLSKLNDSGDLGFTSSKFTKRDDIITNNNISDLRDNLITSAFGPASGFNVYGQIGSSVETFVTALETTNRFRVLSRPSVFALNNKKAVITSGQIIPVPSETISVPGNANNTGSVTTTVTYRDVVLKLEVVPLINADGEVHLTIAQVNDTVIGTQLIEPNEVPIIGTEQIVTSVTVPTGQTVVLGGLISDETKKDTEGLPFLSRIPVVGNLFKDHINSDTRKELIIFIQPTVVTDEKALRQASYSEDIRTTVGADLYERFPQNPPPPVEEQADVETNPKKSIWSRIFTRPEKGLKPGR